MELRPLNSDYSFSEPHLIEQGLPDRVNRFAQKLIRKLLDTPLTQPFTAESLTQKLSFKERLIHWTCGRIFGQPYKDYIELNVNKLHAHYHGAFYTVPPHLGSSKQERGGWIYFENQTASQVKKIHVSEDRVFSCSIDKIQYTLTEIEKIPLFSRVSIDFYERREGLTYYLKITYPNHKTESYDLTKT